MNRERQIQEWLDWSDEEEDIAGSPSEDEIVNDAPINSAHDSESEIEESEDSDYVPESSEVNVIIAPLGLTLPTEDD
ncbi:hypothetical protein FQA39_LY04880 [Lamprigera yunnana]|nr:hypothetical protein FQA39_LY04880 [Lamprigera yunnana]